MPTIDDVAKLAGVSTATVSRVVNNSKNVTSETGQRVLKAMDQLSYYPNKFARGLAANQADGIGVVIQNFADPYFGMVLRGIESVAKTYNLQITVASGNRSPRDELKAIEFLRQQRYNVVILTSSTLLDKELLELSGQGVDFVHLGHLYGAFSKQCVYIDDIEGGALATRYLISQGHRRIAHLAFPKFHDVSNRSLGYRAALKNAGLVYAEQLVVRPDDFDQMSAFRATQELLARGETFSALFASTDLMAMGTYKALRQAGLEVPGDVSIVGYDDIDIATFFYPALTTIKQPIQEMSMAAAYLAIRHLKGQTEGGEVVHKFNPQLVVRDSVKPLHE